VGFKSAQASVSSENNEQTAEVKAQINAEHAERVKKSSAANSIMQLAYAENIENPPTGDGFVLRFKMPEERFSGSDVASDVPKVCENGDPIYTYDQLDRVTSMTSPAGTTTYDYNDTTGRLETITSPEGKTFRYAYDRGQLQSLEYPNGITTDYNFDDNGNLANLDYRNGAVSVRSYGYTYDNNNMRTSMTDVDGVHNYMYDTLYQIIQATHPSIPNPLEQFTYDTAGNRLTDLTHDNYQYNELNQLI
jgi:uncharacterized protein RhaS with RHS repeats